MQDPRNSWSPAAPPSEEATPRDSAAIAQFVAAMRENSVTFVVQLPVECVPALRPDPILREPLEAILHEPCDVALIPFDPRTFAAVITPHDVRPFDPMHVHSLLAMFRGVLNDALGRTDQEADPAREPLIVPLAYVSPVGILQENLAALNEMLETILHKRLRVQFQAIVHLNAGRVYGYEALIRSPQGGVLKKPGQLFRVADNARLVSWLDVACQERCFEQAVEAGVREYLFINMDAEGLSHMNLADHSLADRAIEYGISPERVVMEITERQTVADFPRLLGYIERLRDQGFKIAVDDAGTGYSSLQAITELRPDFVKIDRSLVRNIDTNGARRALLTTVTQFAMQTGAEVIAEGIETRDELATIVEIGVPYAQGYLLSRPQDDFRGLRREMREFLSEHMARRERRVRGRTVVIGEIARPGFVMPPEATIEQVANRFNREPDRETIVIAEEGRVEGLVSRDRFLTTLPDDPEERQKPIAGAKMERRPLLVDADTPLDEVASQATARHGTRFLDDLVVLSGGLYAGIVSSRGLLEAIRTRQINRAKYAHPLTGLSGAVLIEQEADRRLAEGTPTILVRSALNYFRSFNRTYGLTHGDEALTAAAHLFEQILAAQGRAGDTVGHLGGDNFVLLLHPAAAEAVCTECVRQFDEMAPRFYSDEHRRQGYFDIENAQGQRRRVPLMALCLAGVRLRLSFSQSVAALRESLRALKTTRRSGYMIDDRNA